jgi:hypothetical protein
MMERAKLSEQERLYAYLEGKHGGEDDDRDNGRFYMVMADRMIHGGRPDLWKIFSKGFRDGNGRAVYQ